MQRHLFPFNLSDFYNEKKESDVPVIIKFLMMYCRRTRMNNNFKKKRYAALKIF